MESDVEVLVFPSSVQVGDRCGFLLGWRSRGPPSMDQASTGSIYNALIVAGLVAVLNLPTTANHQSVVDEYDKLCARLQVIKKSCCCYCCTCSELLARGTADPPTAGPAHYSCCAGCTRKACIADLDVILWLEHVNAVDAPIGREAVLFPHHLGLPVMSISHNDGEGFPSSWPRRTTDLSASGGVTIRTRKPKQFLLYDDGAALSLGSFQLYRSRSALINGHFVKHILSRMTHASTIMRLLREDQRWERPITARSSRDTLPHFNQDQMKLYTSYALSFLYNCQARSLLVHHLTAKPSSCMPIIRLWKAMYPQSQQVNNGALWGPCKVCQRDNVLPQTLYECVSSQINSWNEIARSWLDWILGAILGWAIAFSIWNGSASRLLRDLSRLHDSFLLRALRWLESFPIGFKLNERLTHSLGGSIRSFLELRGWLVSVLFAWLPVRAEPNNAVAILFLATGTLLGGAGLVALLFDIVRLSSAHIILLAICARSTFVFELYLLSSLWRLFRGKKTNALRKRTDTMEYDSTQLLLGTVLFAVVIFLLTTILVYHLFFAALNMATTLLSTLLLLLYVLFERFPMGSLILRVLYPIYFPRDLCLAYIGTSSSGVDQTKVVSLPAPTIRVVTDMLAGPLRSILVSCVDILSEIILGRASSRSLLDVVQQHC